MAKVLLIYDVDGWCWHHMAKGIWKYSPHGIAVDICSHANALEYLKKSEYDAVLNFSWTTARHDRHPKTWTVIHHCGAMYEFDAETDYWPQKAATRRRNIENAKASLPKFAGVICPSIELSKFAVEIGAKAKYIPAGIDDEHFVPADRQWDGKSKLVVGWAGQAGAKSWSTKGFSEILLPLQDLLGESVEWRINTANYESAIAYEFLPTWYQSIDLFLCTSISEGSPMPPFEAAACGRPVLSTPVGNLPELNKHSGASLVEGYYDEISATITIDEIAQAIDSYSEQRYMLAQRGEFARHAIVEHFSWRKLAADWLEAILA